MILKTHVERRYVEGTQEGKTIVSKDPKDPTPPNPYLLKSRHSGSWDRKDPGYNPTPITDPKDVSKTEWGTPVPDTLSFGQVSYVPEFFPIGISRRGESVTGHFILQDEFGHPVKDPVKKDSNDPKDI